MVRVGGAVKHSESWYDKPTWRLVVENVSPYRGGEHVVRTLNRYCRWYVERRSCTEA